MSDGDNTKLLKFGFNVDDIVKEGKVTWEQINEIYEWTLTEKECRFVKEQLVFYIISCDGDLEFTKKTLQACVRIKKNAPHMFTNRNVFLPRLQKQLQVVEFGIFPERTDDGCIIIYHKLYDTAFYKYVMEDSMKLLFMTLEAAVHDKPPTGLIVLGDMKGIGLLHLTKVRLGLLKIMFACLQEALPMKLKVIHLLNCVTFIDKCLAIVRPFISDEVLSLVQFHPSNMDYEEFHEKCIPKKCLPLDYGGLLPSAHELHMENTRILEERMEFFEAEEYQRYG